MSIQRLAKLLCCTFLLASLSLIALVSGNSSRVVHAEMKHLLRGMVADHTGAAIPNFKVGLWVRSREGTVPMREMGSPVLTAQTDRDGQFSVELQPGSYKVCVVRFPKSCRELLVEETPKSLEYLNFRINPVDDPASSGLLDKRVREISGPFATDCGRVRREDSPKRATKCALRAYKSHKAFYVRYDDRESATPKWHAQSPVMQPARCIPWNLTAWAWIQPICRRALRCPMAFTRKSSLARNRSACGSRGPAANLSASPTDVG